MEDIVFAMRRTQLDEVSFDFPIIRAYLGRFRRAQGYLDVSATRRRSDLLLFPQKPRVAVLVTIVIVRRFKRYFGVNVRKVHPRSDL